MVAGTRYEWKRTSRDHNQPPAANISGEHCEYSLAELSRFFPLHPAPPPIQTRENNMTLIEIISRIELNAQRWIARLRIA